MKTFCALLAGAFLFTACGTDPVPRPRAYFRIDMPAKQYVPVDTLKCPFRFELPTYAYALRSPDMQRGDTCWLNIYFPRFKGEVYLTYKELSKQVTLDALLEDMHKAAYSHAVKADNITPATFEDPALRKFGLVYEMEGDVASQLLFCITDSTRHFVRGALYFAVTPNKDSLAPIVDFIKEDIDHMMRSFRWN